MYFVVTLDLEPRAVHILRRTLPLSYTSTICSLSNPCYAISTNVTELIKQSHLFEGANMRHTGAGAAVWESNYGPSAYALWVRPKEGLKRCWFGDLPVTT